MPNRKKKRLKTVCPPAAASSTSTTAPSIIQQLVDLLKESKQELKTAQSQLAQLRELDSSMHIVHLNTESELQRVKDELEVAQAELTNTREIHHKSFLKQLHIFMQQQQNMQDKTEKMMLEQVTAARKEMMVVQRALDLYEGKSESLSLVDDAKLEAMEEKLQKTLKTLAREKLKRLEKAAKESALNCKICMDNPRNCGFQCGHLCCCMKCANKVDKCPICRAGVLTRIPMFVS